MSHTDNRRKFPAACVPGSVATTSASAGPSANATAAIDFARSYMYCTPREMENWVRPPIECHLEVFDRDHADKYLRNVVAKTGLTRSTETSGLWCFSIQHRPNAPTGPGKRQHHLGRVQILESLSQP